MPDFVPVGTRIQVVLRGSLFKYRYRYYVTSYILSHCRDPLTYFNRRVLLPVQNLQISPVYKILLPLFRFYHWCLIKLVNLQQQVELKPIPVIRLQMHWLDQIKMAQSFSLLVDLFKIPHLLQHPTNQQNPHKIFL